MNPEFESEQRQAAVGKAVSAAEVYRRRGDYEAAWRALDDALAAAPEEPALLEMMGQLNYDAGEYAAAARCFRRALEIEPDRGSAEVGLGKTTLKLEGLADEGQDEGLLADMPSGLIERRQPSAAATLSLCFPGLGQLYAFQLVRGVILLVVAAPLWVVLFNRFYDFAEARGGEPLAGSFWVVAVLLMALHLGSAADAWYLTRRLRAAAHLERP